MMAGVVQLKQVAGAGGKDGVVMTATRPLRILYHHRTRATDAQRIHILELVNAFTALGHEIEVASLVATEAAREVSRDAQEAGWQRLVRRVPLAYEAVQLAYNLVGIPLLARCVRAKRPDFIYERYSLFNLAGVTVARLFGIPVILEVNSPLALEQRRDRQIRAFRFAQWTERVICNLATRVVVVSTPLLEIMVRAGVDRDRLVLMPNGVRTELFKTGAARPGLRAELGLEGKVVIGFVGWFRNWHGLEMLIDSFHSGRLADRGAALLLIGDGPAMSELRRRVDQYGLDRQVVFSGPVPHEQVPSYLDLIDIAVQPAANEYCCPMKLFEYMALGKAIAAPRQANVLDLLSEGDAAFFRPGDEADLARALSTTVADTTRRAELGRRSAEALRTRRFSWVKNAARVVELVLAETPNPEVAEQQAPCPHTQP